MKKKNYILIKDFNRFMYNHWRKRFCRCCLHALITEELLTHPVKDRFKIDTKQKIKMPKRSEYVKFRNFERKIKSPFMIHVDFESILVPEDNGKQTPNASYTKKYQKYVACSYGFKLN